MELNKFLKNQKIQKLKKKMYDLLWEKLLKIIELKLLDKEKSVLFLYVIKSNLLRINRLYKNRVLKIVFN